VKAGRVAIAEVSGAVERTRKREEWCAQASLAGNRIEWGQGRARGAAEGVR
jgi:hypothetical protein